MESVGNSTVGEGVETLWDVVPNKPAFIGIGLSILLICLFGLGGNILSGIIFTRPGHNSSIDCILFALGIADSVFLSCVFLLEIVKWKILLMDTTELFMEFYEMTYGYPYYLTGVAQTNTFLLIMALSWERFVAVCHPLKARQICTWKKARIYVVGISCLSFLLNWPRLFVFEVPVRKAEYFTPMEISRLTMDYALIFVNILIPLASLLYCHTKIFIKIAATNESRGSLTSQHLENIQITKMLIGVILMFLISHSVLILDTAYDLFFNSVSPTLVLLSNFMYTLNSAANFPIYVLTGKRFREEVKIVIFRRSRVPGSSKSPAYAQTN